MKSVTHQSTLHLSFKIKCRVDRLRPPGQTGSGWQRVKPARLTRMYGPAVRCKRFSSSWRSAVLHQCIRSLIGAVLLRTIMDISARAVSLADRPRLGHSGHQCSHAPGRPNLHLVSSSRRPRQERVIDLATSSRTPHLTFPYSTIKQVGWWRLTSPRSPDHEPGLTKRCGPACWPAR